MSMAMQLIEPNHNSNPSERAVMPRTDGSAGFLAMDGPAAGALPAIDEPTSSRQSPHIPISQGEAEPADAAPATSTDRQPLPSVAGSSLAAESAPDPAPPSSKRLPLNVQRNATGFIGRIQREGREKTKSFSIARHSSEAEALAAATAWAEAITALHPNEVLERGFRSKPMPNKSTDLPVGVSRVLKIDSRKQGIPSYLVFAVNWKDATGKKRITSFQAGNAATVTPEEEDRARATAIAYRTAWEWAVANKQPFDTAKFECWRSVQCFPFRPPEQLVEGIAPVADGLPAPDTLLPESTNRVSPKPKPASTKPASTKSVLAKPARAAPTPSAPTTAPERGQTTTVRAMAPVIEPMIEPEAEPADVAESLAALADLAKVAQEEEMLQAVSPELQRDRVRLLIARFGTAFSALEFLTASPEQQERLWPAPGTSRGS